MLQSRIGSGGNGTVYCAWDRMVGQRVAVKLPACLPQHGLWRSSHLLREIAAVANLKHPTLARLIDWGIAGETPFLAYEYLGGGSLADRLRNGGISVSALVRTLALVSMGLAELHRRNWVHGDVKPTNVLFDETDRPRLTDFGLARPVGESSREEGMILASGAFAPSEQLAGEPLSAASDTYALCAVLFTGLTGEAVPLPGAGRRPAAAILDGLGSVHPQIAEQFGLLLLRGLSTDPCRRFPNGAQLGRHLYHHLLRPLPDFNLAGVYTSPSITQPTLTSESPEHRFTRKNLDRATRRAV